MKYDKKLHAAVGLFIFIIGYMVFDANIALGLSVLAGLGKEVYDKVSKKGTPEFMDFVATITIPVILWLIWYL